MISVEKTKSKDQGKTPRSLGTALNARKIADQLAAGEGVKVKNSNQGLAKVQRLYADAIALQALRKMEILLAKECVDEKEVKAVVMILEAARDHSKMMEVPVINKRIKKKKDEKVTKPGPTGIDDVIGRVA